MLTILRVMIFCGVSITKSALSEPAPGWQSAQSRPRSAEITPIAPIKSATVRPRRVGVVTFLKVSPAVFSLAAFAVPVLVAAGVAFCGAGVCADAWFVRAAPARNRAAAAVAARAGMATDLVFIMV